MESSFEMRRRVSMGQFKTMWQHIRRSPYQSLAAVLTMTITFFITSLFIILGITGARVISYFESKPQITAFFKEEATQEDVNELKKELEDSGKVSQTRFVSKEEALKIYQEQNKNDPLLLDLVTADILPASLEVSAVDVRELGNVAEIVKEADLVDEVVFQKDIVDTLTSWTNALRKIGILVFVALSLVALLTIITVIGMKIALRREEIEIMRLVGASSWYIRWPFIFEGMLYGAAGSVFAWGASYLLLLYTTPFVESFLSGVPVLPLPFILMLAVLGVELFIAVVIGMLASFFAVLRYLK